MCREDGCPVWVVLLRNWDQVVYVSRAHCGAVGSDLVATAAVCDVAAATDALAALSPATNEKLCPTQAVEHQRGAIVLFMQIDRFIRSAAKYVDR